MAASEHLSRIFQVTKVRRASNIYFLKTLCILCFKNICRTRQQHGSDRAMIRIGGQLY